MSEEIVKRRVGRPRKSERRRKAGVHGRGQMKLVAPEIQGYYCRWVNDTGTRIHDVTVGDDYEFVTKSEVNDEIGESGNGSTGLGERVSVLVGSDEKGGVLAYLMKKKIDYHEEDMKEKETSRRGKEASLQRGDDKIENQYGSITNV